MSTLKQRMKELSPDRRKKVEARTARLVAEEMTLQELRKARKLTSLRTKRAIVDRALELLVRTETRKGMLSYYGSGIWRGDLKASRRNRV